MFALLLWAATHPKRKAVDRKRRGRGAALVVPDVAACGL